MTMKENIIILNGLLFLIGRSDSKIRNFFFHHIDFISEFSHWRPLKVRLDTPEPFIYTTRCVQIIMSIRRYRGHLELT